MKNKGHNLWDRCYKFIYTIYEIELSINYNLCYLLISIFQIQIYLLINVLNYLHY